MSLRVALSVYFTFSNLRLISLNILICEGAQNRFIRAPIDV